MRFVVSDIVLVVDQVFDVELFEFVEVESRDGGVWVD